MQSLNIRQLDRKMVKFSNYRIIKCGYIIEQYHYDSPYIYNLGKEASRDRIPNDEEEKSCPRIDNLTRAQRKIKRLVNSNAFVYGYHPIFITYTFERNEQDIKRANKCFKQHIDELRRKIGKLRYLAVPELQYRGAIHYHVVFFDLPYIPDIKTKFANSWGQGFVQVKAIQHVNNVGAYVSKYFSKLWHDNKVKGQKGYFTSTGLYQPEVFRSIDIMDSFGMMQVEHVEQFSSDKFGTITYKQYKIINSPVWKPAQSSSTKNPSSAITSKMVSLSLIQH